MFAVLCPATAQKRHFWVSFIGYDGVSPLFASYERDSTDGIYMYADGRLVELDVHLPKNVQCFQVKNGIYVFGHGGSPYRPAKFQFKQSGQNLFFEQTVALTQNQTSTTVAMNNNEFFILAKDGNRSNGDMTSIIYRIKYRNQSRVDTITINECGIRLLDATNDHLYYSVDYYNDDDSYPPTYGSIYQIGLTDGVLTEIAKDIITWPSEATIVPHLNLVQSHNMLLNYKENIKIYSQNEDDVISRPFYLYEYNALVNNKNSSDISTWDCYPLAPGGKIPTELKMVPCVNLGGGAK